MGSFMGRKNYNGNIRKKKRQARIQNVKEYDSSYHSINISYLGVFKRETMPLNVLDVYILSLVTNVVLKDFREDFPLKDNIVFDPDIPIALSFVLEELIKMHTDLLESINEALLQAQQLSYGYEYVFGEIADASIKPEKDFAITIPISSFIAVPLLVKIDKLKNMGRPNIPNSSNLSNLSNSYNISNSSEAIEKLTKDRLKESIDEIKAKKLFTRGVYHCYSKFSKLCDLELCKRLYYNQHERVHDVDKFQTMLEIRLFPNE